MRQSGRGKSLHRSRRWALMRPSSCPTSGWLRYLSWCKRFWRTSPLRKWYREVAQSTGTLPQKDWTTGLTGLFSKWVAGKRLRQGRQRNCSCWLSAWPQWRQYSGKSRLRSPSHQSRHRGIIGFKLGMFVGLGLEAAKFHNFVLFGKRSIIYCPGLPLPPLYSLFLKEQSENLCVYIL